MSARIYRFPTAEADIWPPRDYADQPEEHQRDPDEAYRDVVFDEISDALVWLGLGAIGGAFAVVLSAYILTQTVLA